MSVARLVLLRGGYPHWRAAQHSTARTGPGEEPARTRIAPKLTVQQAITAAAHRPAWLSDTATDTTAANTSGRASSGGRQKLSQHLTDPGNPARARGREAPPHRWAGAALFLGAVLHGARSAPLAGTQQLRSRPCNAGHGTRLQVPPKLQEDTAQGPGRAGENQKEPQGQAAMRADREARRCGEAPASKVGGACRCWCLLACVPAPCTAGSTHPMPPRSPERHPSLVPRPASVARRRQPWTGRQQQQQQRQAISHSAGVAAGTTGPLLSTSACTRTSAGWTGRSSRRSAPTMT
jgi:hypothetical protein